MAHSGMQARVVAALFSAAIFAHADRSSGQCVERSDVGMLKRGLSQAVRCNDRILRRGPGISCPQTAPPACAGTAKTDVVALGYGPSINPAAAAVDSGAVNDQLRCQKQIGKAVRHYLVTKMRALITGRPADPAAVEEKASRHLDKLADRCAVNVAQDGEIVLPNVGPQCAAALPAPGQPVDTAALRGCLLNLLQVWADRWGPNPQPLRPNILFILTDDQRWDSTDATHSSSAQPVMPGTRSEMADNGIEFPNAFLTTPLCCPSRSSILAGSYAHRTGVYRNNGVNGGADDFEDASTIATWLQGAGYRTSLIGKYLNGYGNLWNNGMYVPPNWTEWRALQPVAFFNYSMIEPDGMGGYAETPYGDAEADYSTDVMREKAKTFISDSVALGEVGSPGTELEFAL